MTLIEITYDKLLPTGAYANERIGMKGTLEPGEDFMEAVEKCRVIVEQSHKSKYPHLYTQSGSPVFVEQVMEPKSEEEITRSQQIQGYYGIIQIATTVKQLEMHRGNIEKLNDEQLTEALNNKIKTLTP